MNSVARSALSLLIGSQTALAQSPSANVPPAQVHRSTPVSTSTQGAMNSTTAAARTRAAKTTAVTVGVVAKRSTIAPTSVAQIPHTGAQPSQGIGISSASTKSASVADGSQASSPQSPVMAPTPPSGSPNAGAAAALSATVRRGPKVVPEPSRVVAPRMPETAATTRTPPPTP